MEYCFISAVCSMLSAAILTYYVEVTFACCSGYKYKRLWNESCWVVQYFEFIQEKQEYLNKCLLQKRR